MPNNPITLPKYTHAVSFFLSLFAPTLMPTLSATTLTPRLETNNIQSYSNIQPYKVVRRSDELLVPADGDCLYTSIILGYLLPVVNDENKFQKRLEKLTGYNNSMISRLDFAQKVGSIDYLRSYIFKNLVTKFLKFVSIEQDKWGGSNEITKIANKLGVVIQEHTPDPKNLDKMMSLDLTKPVEGTPNMCFAHYQRRCFARRSNKFDRYTTDASGKAEVAWATGGTTTL